MKLPFQEKHIEDNVYIRIFSENEDSGDFTWHRDEEDRFIEPLHDTDWKIQIDNELPKEIKDKVFIPKEVYHRLIKGSGDLKIKLYKQK
jgi:hypothetical protein